VVVIEDGRLIEEGEHATLLKQNGLYARLYALQHAAPTAEIAAL
jgi:ATP-binding cassette subfamily C protein CydCD